MNYTIIKALERQRYSEVSERQRERNKERVEHASSILAELEKQVGDNNGRLETAKELVSLAGTETRTKGCNNILTDCLKLLRESQSSTQQVYVAISQTGASIDETYCFTSEQDAVEFVRERIKEESHEYEQTGRHTWTTDGRTWKVEESRLKDDEDSHDRLRS